MDPCPVLIGREEEMAQLRALLDAGGGVAIVSGEAGIGKSRLVREFAAEAAERGRVVLWGRPEEVAQPGPFALIVDLLESISEHGNPKVNSESREFENSLQRIGGDGDQRPPPTPRAVAAEIRGLLAQLESRPLAVLEDLHLADEASHSVLLHLARAARDDGHLIITSLRTDSAMSEASLARLIDALLRDRIALLMEVGPLDDEHIAEMAGVLLGREPTGVELEHLRRLGEGVPFFIEELASAGGHGPSIPQSVEQSVGSRVRALGPEAERVLRTASLLAGALDTAVLAYACDVAEASVVDVLIRAARIGILADLEGRLIFRHGLVRDAVAAGLVSVEAAQIHSRLALAIEQVHAEELVQFSAALAQHHLHAGNQSGAARYAVVAGERALSVAATGEARGHFALALELTKGVLTDAIRGLAEVEFRDANEKEAARLFRQAADIQKQRNENREAAATLGRLAWVLQGFASVDAAVEVLEEGLGLLDEVYTIDYARLKVQMGSLLCFRQRQASESKPILMDGLRAASDGGDEALVAEALDALAQVADQQGELEEALDLGRQAIDAARKSGDAEVSGRAHHNHAVKLASSGRAAEALDVLAQGREYLQLVYGRAAVGALDVGQAWVWWLRGEPRKVEDLTARGRNAWQRWRGYRWLLETWAAIELGDTRAARATINQAWAELGGSAARESALAGALPNEDAGHALHAEALLMLAEEASGVVALTSAVVKFGGRDSEPFDLGQTLILHAHALVLEGDHVGGIGAMEDLKVLLTTYPYPYLVAGYEELSSQLALAQGRMSNARQHLEKAVELLESCGNACDQARCLRTLAMLKVEEENGSARSARVALLTRARRLAAESGAASELNRIDSALRSVGVRPRAGRPKGSRSSQQGSLSPREAEVAALVAGGETNLAIAAKLFLSERTVQDHITHALRKLGLPTRAGLASWAVKQGIV